MVEVSQDMVGLEHASAELDKLLAADAATSQTPAQQATPDQSAAAQAEPGQRAAQTEQTQTETNPNSSSKTGTPAAADQKPTDQKNADQQAQQQGKEPSRYEKARRRQDDAWKQINGEKESLRAERERLERERGEFDQQRKAEEARYTPDQYEQAAKKFDADGKLELAELARQRAKELRDNPPPSPQQAQVLKQEQEAHAKAMKEWWGKAAVDFPPVAQRGSPQHQALETFLKAEPEAVRSPKGMYYAARLVSAETAAARVPEMEKELGALRAKVKELEALTAPGAQDIPARAGQASGPKSDAEAFADLERLATEVGALR